MSSLLGSPSSWPGLPLGFLGEVDPVYPDEAELNDLLAGMVELGRGKSFLAWAEYQSVAVLFDRLVAARESADGLVVDGFADCAARIARTQAISQHAAEALLNEAIALRDRLPEVFACLRDGMISPKQALLVVSRTDLLDGLSAAVDVDAEIAHLLRTRRGSWSRKRLRDMCDRIVFRHDSDAVRERRQVALDERGVWTDPRDDGTATITGLMAAENVRIAAAAVTALADAVCEHDGRTKAQRASDAMFALLSGTRFECLCGHDECTAQIPEPGTIPPVDSTAVIHVVCDESTLAGAADHPAYMDGHGVISAEHVRDIAARPGSVTKLLIPSGIPASADDTYTLPAHLPSNPYRPSTALDTFLRIRDGVCVEPGCETSAWISDADHVTEFDHDDPARGGRTSAEGMNIKCRFDHGRKTFGDWLDDQYRDLDGRLHTEFTTPEGLVIVGEAETNEDLFPGLRRIRFQAPTHAPPHRPRILDTDQPTRARTRVANKHARRRAERSRNRRRHHIDGAPPF
ncbi:DUF222 domain-containing protein [Gordonia sp. CPCC 206044]|uniref:DUF222 domain-containing protein n=1 Tax=Gordonia sp. CPCC 206044 TaxID=3140793 RepID=UPI003AF33776